MPQQTQTEANITLYHHPKSGHCHKVALFMHLLDIPFEAVIPDMAAGEHKDDAFLALNPFGQVPVIIDNNTAVSDSNAILIYLATSYASDPNQWLGSTPTERANIQRWFSVAAGELARGPALARLESVFGTTIDATSALAASTALLSTMESHLAKQQSPFLVSNRLTAADVAMYSYVAHAPEGGISLDKYPTLNKWIATIESTPGFVPMPSSDIPEVRA